MQHDLAIHRIIRYHPGAPPISILEAQRRDDLVQGRIALPGVAIELCAFPEVLDETVQVIETQSVLSLGLSRLLAGSEGRAASDRRAPFVRFGALGYRPAGVPVEVRVVGGACHTIRCRFGDDRSGLPAPIASSAAQLAACFDIRSQSVEDAMLRLADKVAHPGPDSAALAEGLIAVVLVDLRRYLEAAAQRAARSRGGLAPHALRRAREPRNPCSDVDSLRTIAIEELRNAQDART